jgi:hypothetical protein
VEVPIYIQCPNIYACVADDIVGFIDWQNAAYAALVFVVNFAFAYRTGRSRELTRIWLAFKKSLLPTVAIGVVALLYIGLIHSPWQRYKALREYARTLNEAPVKTVYQDTPETLKQLEAIRQDRDDVKSKLKNLEQDRSYQKLQMRPSAIIAFHKNIDGAGWKLMSTGPGTAVLKWLVVYVDGVPKASWREVAAAFKIPENEVSFSYPGVQFVPHRDFTLFWSGPDQHADTLHKNYTRVRTELCYCSLAGDECWLSLGLKTEPPKQSSCEQQKPKITVM